MQILVSIDDTDNLESKGTGHLATMLCEQIEENGWGKTSFVSRHQLLVHPDIPYTSHNSAMAFEATIAPDVFEKIIQHAQSFLEKESAEGSDPGLCVVNLAALAHQQALLAYGASAKTDVLSKEKAYGLARELNIHLSEHGGTGDGVIGALAGAGLRLSGNDGRLKGQLKFGNPNEDTPLTATELLKHPWVDTVRTEEGHELNPEESVWLHDRVKSVLLSGEAVLLVEPREDGSWQNLTRKQLKKY